MFHTVKIKYLAVFTTTVQGLLNVFVREVTCAPVTNLVNCSHISFTFVGYIVN